MTYKYQTIVLGLIATLPISPTAAETDNDSNTIVITQKREQSIQDVPISISAFESEFIEQFNITDMKDLVDFTPGFHGKTSNDSFIDYLGIRGITTQDYGVGGDPSIGIYFNNVYQGRNGGAVSSFFDISQVEVVKGPQGTLFGRNAASGAVSIYSNEAIEDTEGEIAILAGENNRLRLNGVYNSSSDNLNYRLAYYHDSEDSYVTNLDGGAFRDREVNALRTTLAYTGFEATDMNLVLSYEDRIMDPGLYRSIWTAGNKDQVDSDLGDSGFDDAQITSAVFTISHAFDGAELTSQTALKQTDWAYYEDYDGTALPYGNYYQADNMDMLSQEFRLNVQQSETLYWFVGLSFYSEKFDSEFFNEYDEDPFCGILPELEEWDQSLSDYQSQPQPSFENCHELFVQGWYELDPVADIDEIDALVADGEIPAPGDGEVGLKERVFARGKNSGYAIYGDVTWQLSNTTDLVLGGRYTYDKKEFSLNLPDPEGWLGHYWLVGAHTNGQWLGNTESWSEFTPRIALNHKFSDNVSGFATFTKGYKAGGHNTFAFNINYQDWTGYDAINDEYTYEPDGVIDDTDSDFWVDELYGGPLPEGSSLASYDPELVDSFELGLKSVLAEDSIKLNVTVYNYDYTDFQGVFPNAGGLVIKNIGEAEGKGIELDINWRLSDNFELYLAASNQNSEVIEGAGLADESLAGLKLNAPENTLALIASVYWTIADSYDATLRLSHNWQSETYSSEFVGGNDRFAIDAYGVTDMHFSLALDAAQSLDIFVENLLDESYYEAGVEDTGLNHFGIGRGRTAGVKYRYVF